MARGFSNRKWGGYASHTSRCGHEIAFIFHLKPQAMSTVSDSSERKATEINTFRLYMRNSKKWVKDLGPK